MSENQLTDTQKKQADQKYCFSCSKLLHFSAKSCPSCGAEQAQGQGGITPSHSVIETLARKENSIQIKPNHQFCSGCGGQVHVTASNCPKCGAIQKTAATGDKSKLTAGLLAILLGGIGVHHFYLKNIGLGILYLVFCWTYIPAIIAIIEGIVLLTKSDEDFNRKYNQ